MNRLPSPTDLTEAQWATLAPLLPDAPWWGRPREVDLREVCNAILSVSRHGIPWDALPHDLPHRSTVSAYFRKWTDDGTWEAVTDALRRQVRRDAGKEAEPSVGIIDRQSVKVTAIPGDRGFDAGKLIKGRKRSIIVDTLGLVLRVVVPPADRSDLVGGTWVAARVDGLSSRLTTLFGDRHDGGQFTEAMAQDSGWTVAVIRRPSDATGFQVLPKRWVVDSTQPHCRARRSIDRRCPVRHHRHHRAAASERDGRANPRSPGRTARGRGCAMSIPSISLSPPRPIRAGRAAGGHTCRRYTASDCGRS
jgi:putative transposase